MAIYYEAASQSDEGQAAVAQVVLNRLRNPLFPKSVCGVVFEGSKLNTGCQFSFTCDGSLARRPSPDAWNRAQTVAARALNGYVVKGVGEAGTIGATPAALSAVVDAVAHLGVRHIDMPATPLRVWTAIREARS